MTDRYSLDRIRQAGLSPYDIKVLTTLIETGGEMPFYVDRLDPKTLEMHVAGMNSLLARKLIMVDEARSVGDRWIIRLTDNGRAVCATLEKMNVGKPAVEVQMHGDVPEVIKS